MQRHRLRDVALSIEQFDLRIAFAPIPQSHGEIVPPHEAHERIELSGSQAYLRSAHPVLRLMFGHGLQVEGRSRRVRASTEVRTARTPRLAGSGDV